MKAKFFILFVFFAMSQLIAIENIVRNDCVALADYNIPHSAVEKIGSTTLQKVILTVPTKSLMISQDAIVFEYEGEVMSVMAVDCRGEICVVAAQKWYQCRNGHTRACPICWGCGFIGCDYYCDSTCANIEN